MKIFKYITCFITIGMFFSCQEDEFIPAQEPVLPSSNQNSEIGDITISHIEVDNNTAFFIWNRQQSAIKYDIIVNDTITIRDIHNSDFGFSDDAFYSVGGLKSGTEHKITIRAFDKNNNIKNLSFKIQTQKDLIANIKQIVLDKHRYNDLRYGNCFITKNKDFIITASAEIHGKYTIIVFKLTKDYRITWLTEIPLNSIPSISEFLDGALLLAHSSGATKLSADGNIVWNKEITISDISIDTGLADDDNTCYLTGSLFEYGPTHQFYIIKLDANGSTLWEDYGDKKTYEDMYWPSKIFINDDNNVVITGGTWNDGMAYGGRENLFFFEYSKKGTSISKKTYTISQIPHYFSEVNYIDKHVDGGYSIFTTVVDFSSGLLNTAILNIQLTNDLNFIRYEKKYFSAGGYFPSITSVYKRPDLSYSWLLHDDRGIIFVNADKDGNEKNSLGLYDFPTGIFSLSDNDDQTIYITKNGLIITLNNEGTTSGYPRFIPDEIIEFK